MKPVELVLLEEGDAIFPASSSNKKRFSQTLNRPGDAARRVLIDRGGALVLRATLVSVTHGNFTPDRDAASLLIFQFNFLAVNSSHRFTKVWITLTFDHVSGNANNRPEVWAIAPEGKLTINKSIMTKDVKQGINTGIKGQWAGVGPELGYVWEASQVKESAHATTLTGVKRLFANHGKDNGVIWGLKEDSQTKEGVPTFLRAATETDFGGRIRRLFGREKADQVDPVQLDSGTNLEELGIGSLRSDEVDLTNMKELDIQTKADVIFATLLERPT
ncbi:hypothetical protein QBC35DRAFT_518801 [Podospora australis]|uniref:Uncharacterized protein n=1 Tax=Podospora australis TaxID=1536484 RepID=A0AAN7ADZ0_9PEZI|nr:hypothetical protein QBC35DRAFT_518801 [Podospora australis]